MDHKKIIVGCIVAMLVLIGVIVGVLFSTSMVGPQAQAITDPRFTVKGTVSNKKPGIYLDPKLVCAFFQTTDKKKLSSTCTQAVDEESFDLKLDVPLDSEAVLKHGYGYGIIVGGFNSSLTNPEFKDKSFRGGHSEVAWANRFAIIYINGTLSQEVDKCHWLRTFPEGYSCGRGNDDKTCTGFEGYQPVDCSEVVLNVDSSENMHWIKFS